MSVKKGDRVEFNHGGFTKYGVVIRGGKKPLVRIDGTMDAVSGPSAAFVPSSHPIPKDVPSVMDKWGVSKFKDYGNGRETPAIEATITLNGKPVIYAYNNGGGGCNVYHRMEADSGDVVGMLQADAKEWGRKFGYRYDFETEDTWLLWAVDHKPFGTLAVDYLKDY